MLWWTSLMIYVASRVVWCKWCEQQGGASRWSAVRPAPYQNLEQLLQVAGDEGVVFVKRPAALLRIIPVTGEVAEYYLQPLLVVTHLTLRQRRAQILRRRDTTLKPDRPEQLSSSPPGTGTRSLTAQWKCVFCNISRMTDTLNLQFKVCKRW